MSKKGYKSIALSFNRRVIIAVLKISTGSDPMRCVTEVDITGFRRLSQERFEKTGEKLSLTAYIVACLAQVIPDYPNLNSFIKGRKQIILDDVTVNVYVEREIQGDKVPEPIAINKAQTKSLSEIQSEIREAQEQKQKDDRLGSLTNSTWIRYVPNFLILAVARILYKSIRFAKKYGGRIIVSNAAMFYKDISWYISNGTTTLSVMLGGIYKKVVQHENSFITKEHLCITIAFDHNIIEGGYAARFIQQFTDTIKNGHLLKNGI